MPATPPPNPNQPAPSAARRASGPTVSRLLRGGGVALGAASCLPMVAMLPGALGAGLATVGVSTTSGPLGALASAIAPVAQPLLLAAVVLLVVGSARCGLSTAVLAAFGGTLLYVSMYALPGTAHGASMSAMATSHAVGSPTTTNAVGFYLAVATIAASFALSAVRRRARRCRPVWTLARAAAVRG